VQKFHPQEQYFHAKVQVTMFHMFHSYYYLYHYLFSHPFLIIKCFKVSSARGFCRPDIQAFCGSARPDHNGQLACLRAHRDRLSEPCKKEELKFSIMEASDLRLIPALTHACTAGEKSTKTQEVGKHTVHRV
jgi:hypothetical protein